jgi:hypothetical protein
MAAIDAGRLDRQRQIWTNLYGPVQAGRLLDEAVTLSARRPELAATEIFALLDPERDDDYVDFVATRW